MATQAQVSGEFMSIAFLCNAAYMIVLTVGRV